MADEFDDVSDCSGCPVTGRRACAEDHRGCVLRRLTLTLALACLAMLAGCATTAVDTSEASPVPPDRLFGGEALTGRPGKASVIVKRDTGFQGSACFLRILVDATPAADLGRGEKVVLHLWPGSHVLSVSAKGLCGGKGAETKAALAAGQTATFRVGFGFGFGAVFVRPTAS
jgi:hypothetical protein